MSRRSEYDESQAARRLHVSAPAFRWARHAGVIPAPDAAEHVWSRKAVEAMDADAIRAALPREPVSDAVAADQIAEALGTPNRPGEKMAVNSFVPRRFIGRGLLNNLSAKPGDVLLNPDQVEAVCRREDLAVLVAAEIPLGPDQAAARLGVRRSDFNHMLRMSWACPTEEFKVQFGSSRAGAVKVPMFRTADIDAIPAAHPEIDWSGLRSVGKGRPSPLAALAKGAAA